MPLEGNFDRLQRNPYEDDSRTFCQGLNRHLTDSPSRKQATWSSLETALSMQEDVETQERDDSSAEAFSTVLELLGISRCAHKNLP